MAKGKKKEAALTPEERLRAALVPEGEQSYKVPENWCWVRFKEISTIRTGKKDANYGNSNGIYPFFTCASDPIRCDGYSFDCNAILLAGNGDISNISRYNGKFEAYQRTYVVEVNTQFDIDYIFYFFKFRWLDFNKDKMFGTAIPYIRLGNLQEFPVPLPPQSEQHRIVTRIESLFAKLDEAKEKAQAVVDGFETRRAAILHRAFTGELTARWRKEHNSGMENWRQLRFDKVANIKCNLVDPMEYQDFPHIAPDNIEKRSGRLLDYHTIAEDNVTSGKHRFYPGQILYSKIRPYLSKVVVAEFDGLCSADMYPIEAKENTRYLWYYMLSDDFWEQASSAGSRSVLPKINQKELSILLVSMTSIPEQQEIVRILDSLLAKEQRAKEAAEAVLERIELIRKAILARAFRGELGTNEPEEESAREMLGRTLDVI